MRATYQKVDALCNETKSFGSDFGPTVTCFKDAHDYFAINCLPAVRQRSSSCTQTNLRDMLMNWFRASNDWHESFFQCLEDRQSGSSRPMNRRKRQTGGRCPFSKLASEAQRAQASPNQEQCQQEVSRRLDTCIRETRCPNFAVCYNSMDVRNKRQEKETMQTDYVSAMGRCAAESNNNNNDGFMNAFGGGSQASQSNYGGSSSSGSYGQSRTPTQSIVEVASGNGDFSTLVAALKAADMENSLSALNTVFAPTNTAFSRMPPGFLDDLLEPRNKQKLQQILLYHVVPGNITSDQVPTTATDIRTRQGSPMKVVRRGSSVRVNGGRVTQADIMATNGVIHAIDVVFIPKTLSQSQNQDIVDVAMENSDFSTLVAAVQAADLVETLKSRGPFTLFAPSNSAFMKLPPGTLDDLLKNKQKLASILEYHVLPQAVPASRIHDGDSYRTVEGQNLNVTIRGRAVVINGVARVTVPDTNASNGVIHEIDTVLLPP